MHATVLRKVGRSVMLTVPRTLLDMLGLEAGAEVDIGIEAGRLVIGPRLRPADALEQRLAQCDPGAPDEPDRTWLDSPPMGRELL